jgi:hypothetical protein
MTKIQFTIDGPRGAITLRAMLNAFQRQLTILGDLDATLGGSGEQLLDWLILDINANASVSALLGSRPRVAEGVPADHARTVGRVYQNGWRVIEGGAVQTPEYYSERALTASKRTLELIGHEGVTGYRVSDESSGVDEPTVLTPRGAVNLDQLIRPGRQGYGSVEGKLSVISVRSAKKPRFEVVTAIAKKAVSCKFDPDLLEDVKAALGRRVIVAGEITYNAKGEPHRLVTDGPIRTLRSSAELPSARELVGAFPDLLGGLTTAEYLEHIRG